MGKSATRFLVTTVIMACALNGAPAKAQYMKGEILLSGAGGFGYPTGTLESRVKSGHVLSGSVDLVLNPSWSVGLRLSSVRFPAEPEATTGDGLVRLRYLTADVQARLYLYPESWFTPYAAGGAGLFGERETRNEGSGERTLDHARPGFVGGVGLSAHRQGARLSIFTEVIYHHLPLHGGSNQYVLWSSGLRVSFGGRPF